MLIFIVKLLVINRIFWWFDNVRNIFKDGEFGFFSSFNINYIK